MDDARADSYLAAEDGASVTQCDECALWFAPEDVGLSAAQLPHRRRFVWNCPTCERALAARRQAPANGPVDGRELHLCPPGAVIDLAATHAQRRALQFDSWAKLAPAVRLAVPAVGDDVDGTQHMRAARAWLAEYQREATATMERLLEGGHISRSRLKQEKKRIAASPLAAPDLRVFVGEVIPAESDLPGVLYCAGDLEQSRARVAGIADRLRRTTSQSEKALGNYTRITAGRCESTRALAQLPSWVDRATMVVLVSNGRPCLVAPAPEPQRADAELQTMRASREHGSTTKGCRSTTAHDAVFETVPQYTGEHYFLGRVCPFKQKDDAAARDWVRQTRRRSKQHEQTMSRYLPVSVSAPGLLRVRSPTSRNLALGAKRLFAPWLAAVVPDAQGGCGGRARPPKWRCAPGRPDCRWLCGDFARGLRHWRLHALLGG